MKILVSFIIGICTFVFVRAAELDAVQQCSTLHLLDLSKFKTNGTEFTAGGCRLDCMIDGKLVSSDPINEGSTCNTVPNGVCHNGKCVDRPTTVRPTSPTTVSPTSPTTTPAPIDPFIYKFDQLNVTIQHSILHETLKETDIIYVEYSHYINNAHQNCETGKYFPAANIAWNSHCLFESKKLYFYDYSWVNFAFHVNNDVRALEAIPIVLTFRKYLVDHPGSVTIDGKVEYLQVFHLMDKVNNQKFADIYVNFEFLKVTKVSD